MMGECKGCGRHRDLDYSRYCPPCANELREMVDAHEVKPLDGDSWDDAYLDEGGCG